MLTVGDKVTRVFNGGITMPLKITEITDDRIKCGHWEFHPQTGFEIDEFLGWDGVTVSGSYLWEVKDRP